MRLEGYDYSQVGMYFVTVVVKDRQHIFGEIVNETMTLNEAGKIVQGVWISLTKQYPVMLDEFVIMPDHIHGIIVLGNQTPTNTALTNVGVGLAQPPKFITSTDELKTDLRPTQNAVPTNDAIRVGLKSTPNEPPTLSIPNVNKRPTPTKTNGLSNVMRFFKSLSAKRVNIFRKTPGHTVWQGGFHDRVIRDEEELNAIRQYIQSNPAHWAAKVL